MPLHIIRKRLQNIYKKIVYSIFKIFYGNIDGVITLRDGEEIKKVSIDNKIEYSIYICNKSRIYTDTITDTAFIINNKIVKGASFQFRNTKNTDISENIVFHKGTPKIKKNLNGTVFSLLTGGAGNANYWHWLFDVLPRLNILKKKIDLSEIDYFLFPDLKEKFQKETLDILKVPYKKRISSINFRHIETNRSIATDHPYVIKNDPSNEIQNLPYWILKFLRDKFLMNKKSNNLPVKFYIDRRDSKSNHRHLRKIINEEEIKKFLKNEGFSIICLSDYSFEDQVSLFSNAEKIVGLHGAGFANLTFCNPETFALELKPTSAGNVIRNLARKIDLNYQDISIDPLENSNNNQQGLIKIPLNLLEKKIS